MGSLIRAVSVSSMRFSPLPSNGAAGSDDKLCLQRCLLNLFEGKLYFFYEVHISIFMQKINYIMPNLEKILWGRIKRALFRDKILGKHSH